MTSDENHSFAKPLSSRLDEAYRNDTLEPQERAFLDAAAHQFAHRLEDLPPVSPDYTSGGTHTSHFRSWDD